MQIDGHLTIRREAFHGFPLPHRGVTSNVAFDLGRKDKEAAVDPAAVTNRLFLEPSHSPALNANGAIAARRLRGRNRGQTPLFTMQAQCGTYIHVTNSVP